MDKKKLIDSFKTFYFGGAVFCMQLFIFFFLIFSFAGVLKFFDTPIFNSTGTAVVFVVLWMFGALAISTCLAVILIKNFYDILEKIKEAEKSDN